MQTDYHATGKLYKKLDSFVRTNAYDNTFIYNGSSNQFKTCKAFKAFLESETPWAKFQVNVARD